MCRTEHIWIFGCVSGSSPANTACAGRGHSIRVAIRLERTPIPGVPAGSFFAVLAPFLRLEGIASGGVPKVLGGIDLPRHFQIFAVFGWRCRAIRVSIKQSSRSFLRSSATAAASLRRVHTARGTVVREGAPGPGPAASVATVGCAPMIVGVVGAVRAAGGPPRHFRIRALAGLFR